MNKILALECRCAGDNPCCVLTSYKGPKAKSFERAKVKDSPAIGRDTRERERDTEESQLIRSK